MDKQKSTGAQKATELVQYIPIARKPVTSMGHMPALAQRHSQAYKLNKKRISFSSLNETDLNEFQHEKNEFKSRFDNFVKERDHLSFSEYFSHEKVASIESKKEMHRKILDIGEFLHEQMTSSIKKECEKKLKLKEIELREKLTEEKAAFAEMEKARFRVKLEQVKGDLRAEYERLLNEKKADIEATTQNVAKEQIELNKEESRRLMDETVSQIKKKFESDRAVIEKNASERERRLLQDEMENMRIAYEHKMIELDKKWLNQMNIVIKEVKNKMNMEFEQMTQANRAKFEQEKEAEQIKIREEYELRIEALHLLEKEKQNELLQLNNELTHLTLENDRLQRHIKKLNEEYQNCVDKFTRLSKNETDFLFPINDDNN